MNIQIRNENAGDVEEIYRVTELAFRDAPHSDHTEQFIVGALRIARALTVSMVAEWDDRIIGHVAVSPVDVSDGAPGWFGLGPISVLPEYQRKGVGTKLMTSALASLETMGASGCVLLGDPDYYRRFGFEVIEGLELPGVPKEYFQARSFGGGFPKGLVAYHEAFSVKA